MQAFDCVPPAGWQADYIGAPYIEGGTAPDGWDCWGLVVYCLANHFGVVVPSYDAVRGDLARGGEPRKKIAAAFSAGLPAWRRLDAPTPGAVALFKIYGRPLHVGLCLGGGRFLHVDRSIATCVESLSDPQWNKRVEGFYVSA